MTKHKRQQIVVWNILSHRQRLHVTCTINVLFFTSTSAGYTITCRRLCKTIHKTTPKLVSCIIRSIQIVIKRYIIMHTCQVKKGHNLAIYLTQYTCEKNPLQLFKNKVDTYLSRVGYKYIKKVLDDKPTASLSTCHLSLCLGWQSC